MEVKNYGFIIKAPGYQQEQTNLNSPDFSSTIIAVSSIEEAYLAADKLINEIKVDLIELCGGFEKEGYQKIKNYVKNKVPVGYVIFE